MKRKPVRALLLSLLILGSLASHLFLNTTAVNQLQLKKPTTPEAQTKTDEEKPARDLVLPDVTIIQKMLELASRLLSSGH